MDKIIDAVWNKEIAYKKAADLHKVPWITLFQLA